MTMTSPCRQILKRRLLLIVKKHSSTIPRRQIHFTNHGSYHCSHACCILFPYFCTVFNVFSWFQFPYQSQTHCVPPIRLRQRISLHLHEITGLWRGIFHKNSCGQELENANFPFYVVPNYSVFLENCSKNKMFHSFSTFYLLKAPRKPTHINLCFKRNILAVWHFLSGLQYNIPAKTGPITVILDSLEPHSLLYLYLP